MIEAAYGEVTATWLWQEVAESEDKHTLAVRQYNDLGILQCKDVVSPGTVSRS